MASIIAAFQWLVAHQFVLGGLVVAILDAVFAFSPGLAANSIIHQIYIWLKGMKAPDAPAK